MTNIPASQINVWLPIITFIAGVIVSRFTMSRAESVTSDRAKFVLANDMAQAQNEAFLALMAALSEYSAQSGKPTLAEFVAISSKSNSFLYQQKMIANAILSDKLDRVTRDETLIPSLTETAYRIIPKVYETLKSIADKNGLPYPAEFERYNYQSIFSAVEKYASAQAVMPPVANTPPIAEIDAKP